MDKMAKEQIEKKLNPSVRSLDDNGVQSPELIKFFREKIADETTKADN